ncbi:MAG: s-methyl-5-thioribose-1-phosphate isomerase [Deltaproteobacteria bacterium]
MMDHPLISLNNTVYLEDGKLVILDRRRFPREKVAVLCCDYEDVARAIEDMAVQGAGDIAITAGYGLYLAARGLGHEQLTRLEKTREYMEQARVRLVRTRPTGFHLAALLSRLMDGLGDDPSDWAEYILSSIQELINRQQQRARLTAQRAETLLADGDTVLSHCFPGAALPLMLYFALQNGKEVKLIATETRPYLQGARLTAWVSSELGVPTTLITDNMVAHCMSRGMITKVFTAADRIALDGIVANKIGTLQIALLARHYGIPMHILGYGPPDKNTVIGTDIPIEMRDPEEVRHFQGSLITGDKVEAIYPAFDLTPPHLIQSIITDRSIIEPAKINTYWTLPKA